MAPELVREHGAQRPLLVHLLAFYDDITEHLDALGLVKHECLTEALQEDTLQVVIGKLLDLTRSKTKQSFTLDAAMPSFSRFNFLHLLNLLIQFTPFLRVTYESSALQVHALVHFYELAEDAR